MRSPEHRARREKALEETAELAQRLLPPEIPLDVVEWMRRVWPVQPPVQGRDLREYDHLAGIEEVVSTMEQFQREQVEQLEAELLGEED